MSVVVVVSSLPPYFIRHTSHVSYLLAFLLLDLHGQDVCSPGCRQRTALRCQSPVNSVESDDSSNDSQSLPTTPPFRLHLPRACTHTKKTLALANGEQGSYASVIAYPLSPCNNPLPDGLRARGMARRWHAQCGGGNDGWRAPPPQRNEAKLKQVHLFCRLGRSYVVTELRRAQHRQQQLEQECAGARYSLTFSNSYSSSSSSRWKIGIPNEASTQTTRGGHLTPPRLSVWNA